MQDMVKLIKIKDTTYDRLSKHGEFKESFDDIVNKVLDLAEGKRKK